MNKLLEIREFESITYNKEYINSSDYKYLEEEIFKELEEFILCNEENSEEMPMKFLKISSKKGVGKVIQAQNYVGIIEMKRGYKIQILPKISNCNGENIKKTFLKMLMTLKDFPVKSFNNATVNSDTMNLYEIFIQMYIKEVKELLKRGLRSSYLSKTDNLNYYKGKLVVNDHIKYNFIHKEKFYVMYDEYDINRVENKLIKSTLLKLFKLSNSSINKKEINTVLSSFEMVNPSVNYVKDFGKIIIDRNTKGYDVLMKWSKVFLLNKSFTAFSGDTSARAILFPMEKVFESYVAHNLKKVVRELGWEISLQHRGMYLFDSQKQFALRPDIVITRENKSKIILDTKWKKLSNNSRKNYGISQLDMYQMYAYAKKYNTSEVWLLYPFSEEVMEIGDINFTSKDNVKVNVFFVDVTNIQDSLEKLVWRLNKEL